MYQKELDLIDATETSDVAVVNIREKLLAKLAVCKQWRSDIARASDEAEKEFSNLSQLVSKSKDKLKKTGKELREIREMLDILLDEVANDDSGYGEMLSTDEPMNQNYFNNRQKELGEALDVTSNELDQLSLDLIRLEQTKRYVITQSEELEKIINQLFATANQIMNIVL